MDYIGNITYWSGHMNNRHVLPLSKPCENKSFWLYPSSPSSPFSVDYLKDENIKDFIFNNIHTCIYIKKDRHILYFNINLNIPGIDSKHMCATCYYTIQINVKKKHYHLYPDINGNKERILDPLNKDKLKYVKDKCTSITNESNNSNTPLH